MSRAGGRGRGLLGLLPLVIRTLGFKKTLIAALVITGTA